MNLAFFKISPDAFCPSSVSMNAVAAGAHWTCGMSVWNLIPQIAPTAATNLATVCKDSHVTIACDFRPSVKMIAIHTIMRPLKRLSMNSW